VFDREIFHILNEKWQIIDLNETSIISCSRASEISKHFALYKSNDLKILCFYDSDDPGRAAFKKNDKAKSSEKCQVSDFVSSELYETMEDLIPDNIFDNSIGDWAKKWKTNIEGNITRPRMKNLEKYFNQTEKKDMKHSLEDIIIETIQKEDLNSFDYSILKEILNKINKVLN